MEAAANPPPSASLDRFLAGLQAGMLGVLWMLAWMGVASAFERRSFWTPENLFATALHPDAGLTGFGFSTLSGMALYLLLYSALGAAFAVAVTLRPLSQLRLNLLAILFGLAWYFASFQGLWKIAAPLVFFLQPTQSTIFGHLIYGALLGRFHSYLPRDYGLIRG